MYKVRRKEQEINTIDCILLLLVSNHISMILNIRMDLQKEKGHYTQKRHLHDQGLNQYTDPMDIMPIIGLIMTNITKMYL